VGTFDIDHSMSRISAIKKASERRAGCLKSHSPFGRHYPE
jgi:hypothetical protein